MKEELNNNNSKRADTAGSKLQKLTEEEMEQVAGGESNGEYTCVCGETFSDVRALFEHQKATGHVGVK